MVIRFSSSLVLPSSFTTCYGFSQSSFQAIQLRFQNRSGGEHVGHRTLASQSFDLVGRRLRGAGANVAERAAQGIVWGAFTNAGQNCAGIERVYVVKSIADRFIDRVVALTKELRPERDTAVMTTKAQRDIVLGHIADAKKHGAKVLCGGKKGRDNELALPPTVLRVEGDAEDAAFMRDETFGPVLPIVVVDSADEAIERANASRYALTTSLWTRRVGKAEEIARRLRSGVVTVNNHAFTAALPAAPWTGAGDSGFGVTNSPDALHALTRVRFVLEDRNAAARELWWYPYTPVLRTIAFAMARLRGGAGFFGRIWIGLKQLFGMA